MSLSSKLKEHADHGAYVEELAQKLASIPSMTGSEKQKAQYIHTLLSGITEGNLRLDSVGNVLYLHQGKDRTRTDIYAAHIDTVFHDIHEIVPKKEQGRIYAPSIYDNSVNAAAMILLIKLAVESRFVPARDILFVFDVGEEGEGDLKGIRHIMERQDKPVHQFIALDLGYQAAVTCGVWSNRYRVKVSCTGGHSWHDFGSESAIAKAAEVIAKLYQCSVPEDPRTIYNVGLITGGTAVNAVASHAQFSLDLRSEAKEALKDIEQQVMEIITSAQSEDTQIDITCIGERPGGVISPDHPLIRTLDAVREELGLEKQYRSASTDANIALSLGIPAVTFGTALGGGTHSPGEYLETESIPVGLELLVRFFEQASKK